MDEIEIDNILAFIKHTEQLKNTLRSAHTSNGRQESTAEHSWRLCLIAMVFSSYYSDIDLLKLLKMSVIHDLGEVINGDIPAIDQVNAAAKSQEERKDFEKLIAPLPISMKKEFLALWDEYENGLTKEAKLAKALDKLETLLQHTQGKNPSDFNYQYNLNYGKNYTDFDQLTTFIRAKIDKETERLAIKNQSDDCF